MKTYTFSTNDSISDDGYATVIVVAKNMKDAELSLKAELTKMSRMDLFNSMRGHYQSAPFSVGDAIYSNVQAR